jgi:hypothetical protein
MVRLSEYDNIIPVGDHCCISMILNKLQLRKQSYPFDWVTNVESLHDTNIIYNTQLIRELYATDNIDAIVQKYLGDAFSNQNVNSNSNIWFPHDTEDVPDIFEKYKRRFTRLKSDLSEKNIFILVTRHYYIEEEAFQKIVECLLEYNKESLILFISGTVHEYITSGRYSNVIFKYIEYDISKFHSYDYTDFRPSIMKFMTDLFDGSF